APLIESVLAQCIEAIGKQCFSYDPPSRDDRWKQSGTKVWDCHWVFNNGRFEDQRNLLRGAKQIAKEIGLESTWRRTIGRRLRPSMATVIRCFTMALSGRVPNGRSSPIVRRRNGLPPGSRRRPRTASLGFSI